MSEQVKDAGSIDGGAGGEADKTSQTVAYESHKKALDQMKAAKRELEAANAKLAELESQKQAEEIKRLEEEKKHKEVADKYKTLYEQELQGRSSLENAIVNAEKIEAFESEIGAKLAHPSFRSHIDLSSIKMVDGEIDADSLKTAVKAFQDTFGTSLLKKTNINVPPANAPIGGSSVKAYADMTPTERADARKAAQALNKR